MTTTRSRERLYDNPPGIAVYSPPELGPTWGRRLLGRLHRVGRMQGGVSPLYDLYIVKSDGMFRKHPVTVTSAQALDLLPDPQVLWPKKDVPADLKRARARGKDLKTGPEPTGVSEDLQPVAESSPN